MVKKCKETLIFVYALFVTEKSGDNLIPQMELTATDGKQMQGNIYIYTPSLNIGKYNLRLLC